MTRMPLRMIWQEPVSDPVDWISRVAQDVFSDLWCFHLEKVKSGKRKAESGMELLIAHW